LPEAGITKMQTFSIRDIENLSGIKAHTLRVWEQRYGLIMPGRKESQHREYTNEDLKQILKISYLYHQGYKISRIARMSTDEVNTLSLEYNHHSSFEVFVNQFIEAALDFDEEGFEKVFNSVILHLGFEKAFLHVVYPYLNKLGMLWMTGNVLPAQEHFSSNLIRKRIILAIDHLSTETKRESDIILLFTPNGEFHEIPLLLSYYFLKKNGFRVAYLGINTSMEDLMTFSLSYPNFILFFHLLTNFTDRDPEAYLEQLCEAFPKRKIFAAGPVFKETLKYPDQVRVILSMKELSAFTI
jgi:MerR family transcriptional regulator, light-induced transcriptional regulator